MDIDIENGIPIPPTKSNAKGKTWSDRTLAVMNMEVGQSVYVRGLKDHRKVRASIATAMKNRGHRFTQRKLGNNRWRIWRVE